MTHEFKYLMYLAGCGARGETPRRPDRPVNWHKIMRLAVEQSVYTLVALSTMHEGSGFPDDRRPYTSKRLKRTLIGSCMRNERILSLLEEARDRGLEIILLKGISMAKEYAVPEARQCGDTDVLIRPKDEKKVMTFLKEKGFSISPRERGRYDCVCSHPSMGEFEVHVDLFSQRAKQIWFQGICLEDVLSTKGSLTQIGAHACLTLDDNSHFIYLILHILNHLVCTGASIGMYLDIGLFLTRHALLLDMRQLSGALEAIGCAQAFSAILYICDVYFGFSTREIYTVSQIPDSLLSLLIDDLESGGSMGTKDIIKRDIGQNLSARQKMIEQNGRQHYWLFKAREYMRKFQLYFLPTAAELSAQYPQSHSATGTGRLQWRVLFIRASLTAYAKRRRVRSLAGREVALDRMSLLRKLGIL